MSHIVKISYNFLLCSKVQAEPQEHVC